MLILQYMQFKSYIILLLWSGGFKCLHKQSGHRPVIRLLSMDQQIDDLLSNRIAAKSPTHMKGTLVLIIPTAAKVDGAGGGHRRRRISTTGEQYKRHIALKAGNFPCACFIYVSCFLFFLFT